MFGENWIALAIFAIAIGLVVRQSGLIAFSVLLLCVVGSAWLWSRYALQGLRYCRVMSEHRAFLGETVDITLEATNTKWLPVPWLRIDDEYPITLTVLSHELQLSTKADVALLRTLVSLRWFERVRWHYQVRCDHRGFYPIGPAHLSSGDLFGLFVSQGDREHQDWLIVYPEVKPVSGLQLPPKDPLGEVKVPQSVLEDPLRIRSVRPYYPTDSQRSIHWKATARRQELQVKVHEPATTHQLVIFLDMATLPRPLQGSVPQDLERAISLAASLAAHMVEQRYQVGVVVNGTWPQSDQPLKVLPGRSPGQLTHVLEALAAVATLTTTSIDELLSRESARLPWGATLAVISAIVDDELLTALHRLQHAGRRVVLLSLDGRPVPFDVPGLTMHRVRDQDGRFVLSPEPLP